MARPKKIDEEQMIYILNSFYESMGDPTKLKYTLLEEYALSLGADVKEYDFRRSQKVRKRIEELQESVVVNGIGIVSFKNLDVNAFINRNSSRDKLHKALLELNEFWRRIYEKASEISKTNKKLIADIFTLKEKVTALDGEKEEVILRLQHSETMKNKLLAENRYLKRMLKEYLYPGIANEILKNENIIEPTEDVTTAEAKERIISENRPLSFTGSVSADKELFLREDKIYNRMCNQIKE